MASTEHIVPEERKVDSGVNALPIIVGVASDLRIQWNPYVHMDSLKCVPGYHSNQDTFYDSPQTCLHIGVLL